MKFTTKILVVAAFAVTTVSSFAQELDVNLQLRPRFEYRNGYKELMKDGEYPTSIISQRSRLNFDYKQDKLKASISLQNVRVWGDVPTTSPSDKKTESHYTNLGCLTTSIHTGRQNLDAKSFLTTIKES